MLEVFLLITSVSLITFLAYHFLGYKRTACDWGCGQSKAHPSLNLENERLLSVNELVEKVDIALQDLERQKFVSFQVPFEGMPDGMTYAKSIIVSYVMYHSSRGWFDVPESFDALFRGETLDEGLESVELDDSEIDGVAFAANHKKNMH